MDFLAIPTMYQGQLFRSRLEARWASFFDSLGWEWEYEPIDLKGYIPDFVLRFHKPLLVEVKPDMELEGLRKHTSKIDLSGWEGEALIVGSCLFTVEEGPQAVPLSGSEKSNTACLGLTLDIALAKENNSRGPWLWNEATFQHCTHCKKFSFIDSNLSWHCRTSGCYDGDSYCDPLTVSEATKLWRQASNAAQWRPGRGAV